MFRIYTENVHDILNEVFPLNPESSYSLRNQEAFATRSIHTVNYGSNYLGPKIWEMVPSDVKNLGTVKAFKFLIKRRLPENYPFRIWKRYVYQVSILWVFYIFILVIFPVSLFPYKYDSWRWLATVVILFIFYILFRFLL